MEISSWFTSVAAIFKSVKPDAVPEAEVNSFIQFRTSFTNLTLDFFHFVKLREERFTRYLKAEKYPPNAESILNDLMEGLCKFGKSFAHSAHEGGDLISRLRVHQGRQKKFESSFLKASAAFAVAACAAVVLYSYSSLPKLLAGSFDGLLADINSIVKIIRDDNSPEVMGMIKILDQSVEQLHLLEKKTSALTCYDVELQASQEGRPRGNSFAVNVTEIISSLRDLRIAAEIAKDSFFDTKDVGDKAAAAASAAVTKFNTRLSPKLSPNLSPNPRHNVTVTDDDNALPQRTGSAVARTREEDDDGRSAARKKLKSSRK